MAQYQIQKVLCQSSWFAKAPCLEVALIHVLWQIVLRVKVCWCQKKQSRVYVPRCALMENRKFWFWFGQSRKKQKIKTQNQLPTVSFFKGRGNYKFYYFPGCIKDPSSKPIESK